MAHPASQLMGTEGKVGRGVILTTRHSVLRLRMSAAVPPHRPMPSLCAQGKKISNEFHSGSKENVFIRLLATPSLISCEHKTCGLFVSGCFQAAHYMYSDVTLSTPSLMYNGYRVSFPGGSGQGVALTTPPI